jgi:putative redox protein
MKDAHEIEPEALKDYKVNVNPVTKATLTWDKELIFVGRTQKGYELEFDARMEWGCIPTESLIISLAGCLAIDTVSFLTKMRTELTEFKIDIKGDRNPTPPQFFKRIDLKLYIGGKNLNEKKVQKAIALSQEKYCSVYHTLSRDLVVNVEYELKEAK